MGFGFNLEEKGSYASCSSRSNLCAVKLMSSYLYVMCSCLYLGLPICKKKKFTIWSIWLHVAIL